MLKNIKKFLPVFIFVIGLIIGGGVIYFQKGKTENFLTSQQVGDKAINFINQAIQDDNATASLINVSEESGVYKIHLKIKENEYDSYVTKDGKLLFSSAFNLEEQSKEVSEKETPTQEEISKSDNPDVKLFVMSYCPFGLQAQKMFLPVYNLLKDKAKMGIYFVNYIMHEKQEIDENLRQYCIQKTEAGKYDEYLNCFVKDGNFEACLSAAIINKEALQSCISATDKEYNITAQYNDKSTWLNGKFPKFDIYSDLNKKYEVQGSPTLVINDQIIDLNLRSPEKLKEAICLAFNTPPEECSQVLSDEAFSPGFGLEKGSSGGSCE